MPKLFRDSEVYSGAHAVELLADLEHQRATDARRAERLRQSGAALPNHPSETTASKKEAPAAAHPH